jgi:outer membrane protein
MKATISILPVLCLGVVMLANPAGAQTAAPPAGSSPAPAAAPAASPAGSPAKIGVIDIQAAIVQTKDGQKAANDLKAKFTPKQDELAKKQQDVAGLQDQLRKGENTMSPESKQKIMRDIDQKNTTLKRDTEDANADLEQEQQRIMGDLGPKIISVLNKYATENGYALVVDISSQQTPVLFASSGIDITRDIIALYDKTSNFAAPAPTNTRPIAPPKPPAAAPAKTPGPK